MPPYNPNFYAQPPYAPIPPIPPPLTPLSRFPTGAVWLIGLGCVFLLATTGIFEGIRGNTIVGLALMALGIWIFVRRMAESGPSLTDDGSPNYRFRLVRACRGAFWLFFIGLWLLLESFHILRFEHTWPLFLIFLGVLALLERVAYNSAAAAPYYAAPPVPPVPTPSTDLQKAATNMASYPPPPPATPPYGPPFAPDPRDASAQRRFFRDQARAQKAAYRQQRDMYRNQTRSLRRSSILGPLLLLSIGIIALLLSTGRIPFLLFTAWYARFWPLLIVAAGLILLAEWAVDQYVFSQTKAHPTLVAASAVVPSSSSSCSSSSA